jgi:hypothetical protein
MRNSNAVAAHRRRFGKRQRQAIGHAQLLHHQVHARGFLGHRVLHLQARVDLQERDLRRSGSSKNSTVPALT